MISVALEYRQIPFISIDSELNRISVIIKLIGNAEYLSAINEGASAINDGASAINDGASAINDGASAINEGASAINDGASAINEGSSAINGDPSAIKELIIVFLTEVPSAKNAEISKYIGLKPSRTRDYLKELINEGTVVALGANKNRVYKLKN